MRAPCATRLCHSLVELGGGRGPHDQLGLATHAAALHDLERHRHDGLGHVARAGHNVGAERGAIPHVTIVALVVDAAIRVCSPHICQHPLGS